MAKSESKIKAPKSLKKPATNRKTVSAQAESKAPERKAKPAPRPSLLGGTPLPKDGALIGWRLVDANGMTLGRLSSRIAMMLMGKDKASFTRFADTGDHVVVVNAEKVLLTGKKWATKTYYHHSNYPGGIKSFTARQIQESRFPERILKWAVYGMLPKGHMGRRWYKKLHVYAGPSHPHVAQQPAPVFFDRLSPQSKG